jgi:anti-anti-sigma regulatory factor
MQATLEQSAGVCRVRLQGDLSIASAAELKASLLGALASATELQVDLAEATALDITAMQLLWAANEEARRSGHAFTLAGNIPEEMLLGFREAGFENIPIAQLSPQSNSTLIDSNSIDSKSMESKSIEPKPY